MSNALIFRKQNVYQKNKEEFGTIVKGVPWPHHRLDPPMFFFRKRLFFFKI